MKKVTTFIMLVTVVLFAALASTPAALAQGGDPPQVSVQGLNLFTPYPDQEAAIGEDITFNLTLRTGGGPQIVRLDTKDVPEGWTVNFRGGGRVVQAAYVDPKEDTKIDLRVEPPATVKPGTYSFTVTGQAEDGTELTLPISLAIKEKLPPNLKFEVELPTLRGTPDATFRYNASLKNEGDQDLTVNLLADVPQGFQADFKLSGQDVANIPLAANETKRLSVEVKALDNVPAGSYPINIVAQGGEIEAKAALTAEVTGQVELNLSAPDGRLSGQAYVGSMTPLKLVVQNSGSAPARNVELSSSQPAGWKVTFDPPQIAEIPSGEQVEVTANVQPAEQAIAGDYVVTLRAKPDTGPTKSSEFRITVLTSTLWGVVGIALIAVAVAVVGLAVMRFGRR